MGTAVAKRSIWAGIQENPFPHFDAEGFRSGVALRLQAYAARVGGSVTTPPLRAGTGDIFRLRLADLPFPDGPGRASIEVTAYKAFGRLYVSLVADHDRLFRSLDGTPGNRLYLHDFKFVRSYGPERAPTLGEIDDALDGLERARTAVQSRNRSAAGSRSPLARIRVALRSGVGEDPEASPEEPDTGAPDAVENPLRRRREVLDALRAAKRDDSGPRKIRIRRRKPREDEADDAP